MSVESLNRPETTDIDKIKIRYEDFDSRIDVDIKYESKKEYDPDERIEINDSNDNKETNTENKFKNKISLGEHEVLDSREISQGDIRDKLDDYLKDLKDKSEFDDTIKVDKDDVDILKKISPEECAENRKYFDKNKNNLISQWEKDNGRDWPKYTKNVYDDNGKLIRQAGQRYDAHHIIPLELGGENKSTNITPLDIKSHKQIHSNDGSCKNLVDVVKGETK